MNGNVYPGASFSAGSFGGMVIHPEEKAGTDSLEGCYERRASTTGLVRRVKKVDGSLDNGKKIFAAKDRPEIKEQIDAWIDDICTGLVRYAAFSIHPGSFLEEASWRRSMCFRR